MTFYALIHGDNDYALFHVAYILWLMYSESLSLRYVYQASKFGFVQDDNS